LKVFECAIGAHAFMGLGSFGLKNLKLGHIL
jgi:hypothetical protein